MTYVIAGVSGHTGSVAADTLLSQGERVRVLVRDPSKGEPYRARGAEVAVADLLDTSALTAALRGAKGAFLLLPPVPTADDVVGHSLRVTESIATAVEAAGVPHVVFLSSIGAHLPSGTGPIRTVANAERRFASVRGTRFTFLRPAYFMENLGGSLGGIADSVFPTFLAEGRSFPMIATRDIGRIAARQLVEGPSADPVLELAGPVELSVGDIVRVVGEVVGKPIAPAVAPVAAMTDALVSFGVGRDLAGLYAEMTDTMNRGELVREGNHRFERGSTGLADVVRGMIG